MQRCFQPSRLRVIVLTSLLSCIVGCATINDLAPPIDAQTLSLAQSMGYATERVEHGRTLYITACVQCHSPEAVTRYSWERWSRIIPKMIDRSDLHAEDRQALTAYIKVTLHNRAKSG